MNLNTVIERMPLWYLGRRSVYLKSPPGTGKTSTMTAASAILSHKLGKNIGHVVINGALLNPPDSIGYLIPKHMPPDANGISRAESVYTDPFYFRTREGKRLEEYDGGIIIVDEIDKADVDVKKIIGEAALSGRLGPHQLPPGWLVWMAGNRQQDRSGSTKELDHLINRRMEIEVEPDFKSWENWANLNGILAPTLTFAEQNPTVMFATAVPDKQGPWATPRSVSELDAYLRSIIHFTSGSNDPGSNLGALFEKDQMGKEQLSPQIVEEASGMIGTAAAAQYFNYFTLAMSMPKFEDIVASPKTVSVPNAPDAQMLVCYSLAHRVTAETAGPVIEYVERLPKDFAVTFANSAAKRRPILVTAPGFKDWLKQNSALLSIIALA
jgi:hypothetical protein